MSWKEYGPIIAFTWRCQSKVPENCISRAQVFNFSSPNWKGGCVFRESTQLKLQDFQPFSASLSRFHFVGHGIVDILGLQLDQTAPSRFNEFRGSKRFERL